MRAKLPAFFIAVVLFFSVLLAGQLLFSAKTVYAAVDTAADRAAFQTKLTDAMTNKKPLTYNIVFTGGNLAALDLNGMLSDIFKDEYLYYSLKSYGYKATGIVGNITVTFTLSYWETAVQKAAVDTNVAMILGVIIKPGMNDFAKEKAIHDWIITHVAYDTTLVQHSAYAGLFGSFKTVCQGYALLAYRMLTDPSVNIQAHIVEGVVHKTGHTWILAQIDGQWYHLDPTWDDPVPDVVNRKVYAYYNLTDAQIAVDHTWSKTSPITYPLATTEFADTLTIQKAADPLNASLYQGLEDSLGYKYLLPANTISTKAEIVTLLQAAMSANQSSISFLHSNVVNLVADLKAAISSFNNITSYSYSSESFTRTLTPADGLVTVYFNSNTPVQVTSVSVSPETATIKAGGPVISLITAISPPNASNKTLNWVNSDSTIASISKGVVKGLKGGTVTISVYSTDGTLKFGATTITVLQPVSGVAFNKKTLLVKAGAKDSTLIANVLPINATVQDVTYSSNKPDIAFVDNITGEITGIKPGVAVITAKSVDGSKIITATVTVPVNATGITLDKKEYFIALTKTAPAIANVQPIKATTKTVVWDTADHNVATVGSKGIIIAGNTPGSTELTATTVDEGITVTAVVYSVVPVKSIAFTPKSAFVKVGETLTISPVFTPNNATIQDVTYISSKPGFATVSASGLITGVAPGITTITATTREGKKIAAFLVTVPLKVDSLDLNKSGEVQVNVGKPVALLATILPSKATIKTVSWTSSNDLIAKVSKTGMVTGISPGNVTITAAADDNLTIAKTVTVAVYNPLAAVSFPKASLILKYHTSDSSNKAVYVKPDATLFAGSTVYSSSNTNAVTIDSVTGDVYGAGGGISKINVTVTAHDVTRIAFYTVTVPYPVLSLTIPAGSTATLAKTKTLPLTTLITPSNAANKVIAWTSSNSAIATVIPTTGLVTAKSSGSTIIRATSAYDNSIFAEITINVP